MFDFHHVERMVTKKQPNETCALKGVSGLPGQRPNPKYCLIQFE